MRPAGRRFRLDVEDGLALAGLDYAAGHGDGEPLLLLHGGMAHARWFDLLAPLLADAFRPLAIDRRGHGDSDWVDPSRYGWERDLADVISAMGVLDRRPWLLVGHSQGGLLAADLAARRLGSIAGLVLLDVPLRPTGPRLRRTGEGLRRIPQLRWPSLDDAARGFRPFPSPHYVPPHVLDHLARTSFKPSAEGGWTSKFHWKVFQRPGPAGPSPLADFAERIRQIDVPTLCLRGADSTILSRDEHLEMARRIPHAVAVEIPGSTHNLHVEAPEAVAEAIVAFAPIVRAKTSG
jgi:pimeloyl-ACP methyl ester carboxylesterase